jgi:uncharacterized membrane protein YqhA
MTATSQTPPTPSPPDPAALLRSRNYLVLVVLGALVGAVVALVAYFFLKAVGEAQHYIFTTLPTEAGYGTEPIWWAAS